MVFSLRAAVREWRDICRRILEAREEVVTALMNPDTPIEELDGKCEALGMLGQQLASHAGELASYFDVMEGGRKDV
jgi:hypothetical protein